MAENSDSFDYDDFEDDDFHDGGRSRGRRGIATLIALCVLAMLALGAYIALRHSDNRGFVKDWRENESPYGLFSKKDGRAKAGRPADFEIAGVRFGMTPTKVGRIHPNPTRTWKAGEERLTTFQFEGGTYTLRFLPPAAGSLLYQIHYNQAFRSIGEAEVLAPLTRKYGKPASSDCSGTLDYSGIECLFRFWPSGGLSLKVKTRTVVGASGAKQTTVTLVATDIYLQSRRPRASAGSAGKSSATPPKSPSKTEKLPF